MSELLQRIASIASATDQTVSPCTSTIIITDTGPDVYGSTTNVAESQSVVIAVNGTNYQSPVDASGNFQITGISATDATAANDVQITASTSDSDGCEATAQFVFTECKATISIASTGPDVDGTTTNIQSGRQVVISLNSNNYTGVTDSLGNWSITGVSTADAAVADGVSIQVSVDDNSGCVATQDFIYKSTECNPPLQDSLTPTFSDNLTGSQPTLYQDYTFDSGVVGRRITDHADFLPTWRIPPVHKYSRLPVWSSDMLVMDVGEGPVSAVDFSVAGAWPTSSNSVLAYNEPYYYGLVYQSNELKKTAIDLSTSVTLRDFSNDGYILNDSSKGMTIGNAEGSISADDRYVLLAGYKSVNGVTTEYLCSYDIVNDSILGEIPVPTSYDHASFTKSGNYIVVGQSDNTAAERLISRYNPDLSGRTIIHNYLEHYDLYQDAVGDDWLFMMGDGAYGVNSMQAIRIKDALHMFYDLQAQGHVSAGAIDVPGLLAFSINTTGVVGIIRAEVDTSIAFGSGSLSYDYLGESGTINFSTATPVANAIEIWGYHASNNYSDFKTSPRASMRRDGKRLVVASDWNASGDVNLYELRLPC